MAIRNPKMYDIPDKWIPPQGGIIRDVNVRNLTEPDRILFYNVDVLYSQSQKIVSQNEMILSYLKRTMGEAEAAPSALPHSPDLSDMPIPTKVDVIVKTSTSRDCYTPDHLPGTAGTDRSKRQSPRQSFQATSAMSTRTLDLEVSNANLIEEHLAGVPAGAEHSPGLRQISSEQALTRNATNESYIVMSSEQSTHFSTESDLKSQAFTDAVPPLSPKGSNNHSESEEFKARSNYLPQPILPMQKMQGITKTEQESSSKLPVAAQPSSLSPALALSKVEQTGPSSHAKTSHPTPDTSGEHSHMGPENPNEAQKPSQIGTSAQRREAGGNQLPYVQRFQKRQQSPSATPEKLAHPTTPQPPVLFGSALDELQGLIFEPTPPASEPSKASYTNAGKDQPETKPSKNKGQGAGAGNNEKQTAEKRGVAGVDADFLSGMFQTEMESIEYYKPDLFGSNNPEGSQASRHRNAHLAEATKLHVTIFLGRLADGEIEPANYDGLLRFVTALQDRDYKTAQSLMADGLQARASGSMQEGFPWMDHLIDLSKAACLELMVSPLNYVRNPDTNLGWISRKRERKVKRSKPL
ncbi:MAG: hypothetical protein Q9214_000263 [Letrouitia sp. 1 TL-2023]